MLSQACMVGVRGRRKCGDRPRRRLGLGSMTPGARTRTVVASSRGTMSGVQRPEAHELVSDDLFGGPVVGKQGEPVSVLVGVHQVRVRPLMQVRALLGINGQDATVPTWSDPEDIALANDSEPDSAVATVVPQEFFR